MKNKPRSGWSSNTDRGRIGDVKNGHFIDINYDGTFLLYGNMTAFDDLKFPSTGINPPGAVDDPDRDTSTGLLVFDSSKTETVAMVVQLSHSWKEGSDLFPHVHWMKSSSASGDVVWQLEYKWAPIGEVADASWTTLSSYTLAGGTIDTNTEDKHLITPLGTITSTGKQISDMIMMKLSRVGGDANDTYGADAQLLEFDIHFEVDSFGSNQEYIK